MKIFIFVHAQIKEMIIEQPAILMEIAQSVSGANVTLKITYEFSTMAAADLVKIINHDMSITALGNILVATAPQLTIFEPTGTRYLCSYFLS